MRDLVLIEIRDAVRALAKRPALTLIAILVVSIGLTATTSVTSIINSLYLRPSGYSEPERIVGIQESHPLIDITNYSKWLEGSKSFEYIAGYTAQRFYISGEAEPKIAVGFRVSRSLFSVLGAQPFLGRTFTAEEEIAGKGAVAVLSYSYWRNDFAGSSNVIGRIIKLNGKPATIIGVMPRGFSFPHSWRVQLWVPFGSAEENNVPLKKRIFLVGRLRKDVNLKQLQSELDVLSKRSGMKDYRMTAYRIDEKTRTNEVTVLDMLSAASILVMLICCANISSLLGSRGADRAKEVAIRNALGSGRATIIRQFLFESIVLFSLGSVIAIIFTIWIINSFPTVLEQYFASDITIDWRVLGISTGIAFFTGLLAGIVPAVRSSKTTFPEALKEGGHRTHTDRSGRRVQKMLAIIQISFSVCLLIGSGLLVKTLLRLQSIDPGFEPSNLITLYVGLPTNKYKEDHQQIQFFDELLQNVRALPGVESAGLISNLPLGGTYMIGSLKKVGNKHYDEPLEIYTYKISSDYFSTMKIPIKIGREFSQYECVTCPGVAIINEKMAKELFGTREAVGSSVLFGEEATERRIIGVVSNVRHFGLESDSQPEMYLPFDQSSGWLGMNAVIRSTKDLQSIARDLRSAVWRIDPDQPLILSTMEDEIKESLGNRRPVSFSLTLFAILSLLLTCTGVYGVTLYSVVRRTFEIGVRIAMGASASNILRSFLKESIVYFFIGSTLGVILAMNLTRFIRAFLWNVQTNDISVYSLVISIVLIMSIFACLIPIVKAMRINPIDALRYE